MERINLSPAEIDAFLSLAETGSFSRTGAALGLSQPAVSARISHLEQTLGVPLFHRTTRRVTITVTGERLRVRLERAMAELRALTEELREEADLRRGPHHHRRLPIRGGRVLGRGPLPRFTISIPTSKSSYRMIFMATRSTACSTA